MANEDEILIKEKDGTFKILKGGQLIDVPQGPSAAPSPPTALLQQAKNVFQKAGVSIPEGFLDRAVSIVLSRLKDVRDSLETKEALMKSPERGGLGFSVQDAARLVEIAETHLRGALPVQKPQVFIGPSHRPPLPRTPLTTKPPRAPEAAARSPRPQAPPVKTAPPPERLPQQVPVRLKVPGKPKEIPGKVRIMDVRPPSKLISPAEELKMSLVDFRRMAPTPQGAANMILNKIDMLGEESFSDKLEGIKSWRESEPYRLYSSIIEESVAKEKSFTEVIKERTSQGRQILTSEEFSAILELGKKLRF